MMSTDVRPRIQYLSSLNTAVSPGRGVSVIALDNLVTGDFSAPDCHPQESPGTTCICESHHSHCPGPLPVEASSNGMCPSPFSIPMTLAPSPTASSRGWSPPESMACWEPTGRPNSVNILKLSHRGLCSCHSIQKQGAKRNSQQFGASDPDSASHRHMLDPGPHRPTSIYSLYHPTVGGSFSAPPTGGYHPVVNVFLLFRP